MKVTWYVLLAAMLCMTSVVQAQILIKGKVSHAEDGEALVGATVRIKGQTSGAFTDETGSFQIQVVDRDAILLVSYVGFTTQEIRVGDQNNMMVLLEPEVNSLEEVVITAYGLTRRGDLTGSIGTLQGATIDEVPVVGVDQALQGRVAGVNVISSNGQPGGGVSVRVRGPSSINSNNQPLYVIDGIPVETQDLQIPGQFGTPASGGLGGQKGNTMSSINFTDVESIQVLKDASATALYGSRAANGVILITTKRGKYGQGPQLDVHISRGVTEVFDLMDMLNAQQYKELVNESRINGGREPFTDDFFGTADTDWQDQIFKQADIQRYDFSLKGGTANTRYFASVSVDDQEGTMIGTDFQRISGRLNLDTRISEKLSFGTSTMVSLTNEDIQANDNFIIGPYYAAFRARPDLPVRNEDGSFTALNTADHPVAAAVGYNNNFQTMRVLASVFGIYEITSNLRLKSSIAADYTNMIQDQFWNSTTLGGNLFGNGYAQRGTNEFRSVVFENTLDYNVKFGEKHDVGLLLGSAFQRDNRRSIIASATGFPNDVLNTFASAATPLAVGGIGTERALTSFFGRLNYNFDNRFIITANIRADGSSRFGNDNRWGFFPSAAVAWRISNEQFLEGNNVIDELKIRASWGLTGNDRVGNFASLGLFSSSVNGVPFAYAGQGGVAPSQIENAALQWETTEQIDVGLDFALFDNRLSGSVDFYWRNSQDILLQAPVPRNSGFNSVNLNIGEMENVGVDISLQGDIIRSNNFTWTLGGNINFNDNEIVKLVNGEDIAATGFNQSIIREGEDLGSFFGWEVAGIFQTQEEVNALNETSPTGVYQTSGTAPGDFRYRDINGDGVINNDDRTILGSAQYEFMGGVTNSISLYGFTLDAFFQFVQGNEVFNLTAREVYFQRNLNNSVTDALNRWTPTDTDTDVARVAWGDPNQNRRNSSFFVEDGSYIRLRQLRLAYSFPDLWFENNFVRNLTLYVQGNNLITITDYSGVDPEVNTFSGNVSTAQGVDNSTYPGGKTYTVGINLGL